MAKYKVAYGRKTLLVDFPERWDVRTIKISKDKISQERIRKVIVNPTGSLRIKDIAHKGDTIAIVIEDHTRCTLPSVDVMNVILEELKMAGVRDDDVFIIGASAAHRKMVISDFEDILGVKITKRFRIVSHDLFDENILKFIGNTSFGTPVWINSEVANSDIIIGVGGIAPHGSVGFSGGAKLILPGVAGYSTILYNHTKIDQKVDVGSRAIRLMRLDMEEACRMVGMDFVIAGLIDSDLKLVDMVAGDPIEAHRKGIEKARELYQVKVGKEADIVVACSYPLDIDFFQSGKGLFTSVPFVKKGGIIVWVCSCIEGFGCHYLNTMSEVYKMNIKAAMQTVCDKATVIFSSENLKYEEIEDYLPKDVVFVQQTKKAIEKAIDLQPKGKNITILYSSPFIIGC